jgi:hypothetical protein
MEFSTVIWLGRRVDERWMVIRARFLRPEWLGTITSMGLDGKRIMSQNAAADRCDKAAPGPQASTAASHLPSIFSHLGGTSSAIVKMPCGPRDSSPIA